MARPDSPNVCCNVHVVVRLLLCCLGGAGSLLLPFIRRLSLL
jgi:hypothetical protein